MVELYDAFPCLDGPTLIIRKMTEDDLTALTEITENANVYRFIPPMLFRKSKGNLLAAIRNLGGRDFDKKKWIIAGVYRRSDPQRLIGLAEMFDYHRRTGQITIGYRLNEREWHQGFATEIAAMLVRYLMEDIGLRVLKAYVMPENVYSAKALLKNGFIKEPALVHGKNWGGRAEVELEEYTHL